MVVVLQWYYTTRDLSRDSQQPQLVGIFGPFTNKEDAEIWKSSRPYHSGWGWHEYQIMETTSPS